MTNLTSKRMQQLAAILLCWLSIAATAAVPSLKQEPIKDRQYAMGVQAGVPVSNAVVTIIANDPEAGEPGHPADSAEFTVIRSNPDGTPATEGLLTVYLQIDGTADNGYDYAPISDVCTFNDGESQCVLTIWPFDDGYTEGDETIVMTIADTGAYTVGTPYEATAILYDAPRCVITTSINPGKSGSATGAGTYNYGSTVTLSARAAEGFTFVSWTLNGVVVNTTGGLTITNLTAPYSAYTANFRKKQCVVSAKANPTYGGTVTGAGTYDYLTRVTLTATPAEGYEFVNWTVNNEIATIEPVLMVTGLISNTPVYTANFRRKQCVVTTAASPEEGGTVTGEGTYDYGSIATLKATPAPGYMFTNWTLNNTMVSASPTLTIPSLTAAESAYTAHFKVAPVEPIVTITANDATASEPGGPEGTGQFTITRSKLNGTSYTTGETIVNLQITGTATNGVDYTTISTTSPLRNGNTQNTKTVTPLEDTLHEGDETVIITILPGEGYSVGTPNTATVTIKDVDPAALCVVKTAANPAKAGTVTGAGTYMAGGNATLKATAANGYAFENWTLNGDIVGTAATLKLTNLTAGKLTYTANFKTVALIEPVVTITLNDAIASEPEGIDGTGQFAINRKKANGTNYTTGTTTVNLQITGTATNGVDYTTITNTSKISSGKYQNTKTVTPLKDGLIEGDETVVITILPGDGYVVGSPNTATVIIRDIDRIPERLAAPANLTASSGTVEDYVALAWSGVMGATHYQVYRTEKGSTEPRVVHPWAAGTSWNDTTAVAGVIYSYQVKAAPGADDANSSAFSEAVTGYRPLPAPTVTATKDLEDRVAVAWISTGTYFRVIRAESATGRNSVTLCTACTAKSWDDTTAEPGRLYYYFVTASLYADVGESPASVAAQGMRLSPLEPVTAHPADADGDGFISGGEYLAYMVAAKNAAIFDYEVSWDGTDVCALKRYDNGEVAEPGELSRIVSTHAYGPDSTVKVTYAVNSREAVAAVFTGDVIPEGWTLENANGGILADGVLRFAFGYPDVPVSFSYTLRAPKDAELKDACILSSNWADTAVALMDGNRVVHFDFSDKLICGGIYHPADTNQDNHISGLELLAYAGAAKAIALSHCGYSWDGRDVLTLASTEATRGGAVPQLARRVSTADFTAGSTVTVTLDISGAADMSALFIGENIPAGWKVVDTAGGMLVKGVLKFAFEAPAIPSAISYTIAAPAAGLKAGYVIRGSRADTGCYANGVIALAAEDTVLGAADCGVAFDEWPLDGRYYAADGASFSWPAISGAASYLLTVYDAAGAVVAAKSVTATSASFAELPCGTCRWDVTADGVTSPAQPLAANAAVIGGFAADDAAILFIAADDAVIDCDVLFYSAAGGWTTATCRLQVQDGAARLELGQPAAGGYLCVRPQGAADYMELFLE